MPLGKIFSQILQSISCFAVVVFLYCPPANAAEPFSVIPATVTLQGNYARSQLIVSQTDAYGQVTDKSNDLSGIAKYSSSNPQIVSVNESGLLLAVGDGTANIIVSVEGVSKQIPITVEKVVAEPAIDYTLHVRPILDKVGCAFAACHASQFGKGGFKLTVFGFDPGADRKAIAHERLQRRVDFFNPENSLFLQKPTMKVPHGGGRRLRSDSVEYDILAAWIRGGAPGPAKEIAEVVEIKVSPKRRIGTVGIQQQLRVDAVYSDGTTRDVTSLTKFDSQDDGLMQVDKNGLVTVTGKGQAPIMIRYEGQADISMFVIPYSDSVKLTGWKNNNYVDEHAAAKFQELGIEPSPLCDDATFIRRAFLDSIGTIPTPKETTAFLESNDPKKREQLIERLLGLTGNPQLDIYNDQYAAYWTLKWSDLIRNNSNAVGEQGMWSMHNWIRESMRTNKPFSQFVSELVTGKGSIYRNGPANYFRINANSSTLAESTAQLFMGIRLECAKCHHHPFEKYSQADYYGFAAFFSRVGTKNSQEFGLFGRESVVIVKPTGDVRHPKTRKLMKPTPLEGESVDHPLDRRIPLAKWLTSKDNSFFAKSTVNRYMSYLLGRGLVEQVDDLRSTNPPTNVALMNALSSDFAESGFDLKHLIRTIMTSRLYQLDSQPTPQNASDDRFYSHFRVKRIKAEPLLDAIDRVSGIPTKFKSLPLGTRAIELPDAEYPNYFLTTFAKPRRTSVCECERSPDENLAQALHTLNGDILATKIADKKGFVAKLLAAKKSNTEIVNELYLTALCRKPSSEELSVSQEFLEQSPSPKECYEDLLWALINSKQFMFIY